MAVPRTRTWKICGGNFGVITGREWIVGIFGEPGIKLQFMSLHGQFVVTRHLSTSWDVQFESPDGRAHPHCPCGASLFCSPSSRRSSWFHSTSDMILVLPCCVEDTELQSRLYGASKEAAWINCRTLLVFIHFWYSTVRSSPDECSGYSHNLPKTLIKSLVNPAASPKDVGFASCSWA